MPPKPRPNILPKQAASVPIDIGPRPLATTSLPSPSASVSSPSSAGSSMDSTDPAPSTSPSESRGTSKSQHRVASNTAPAASNTKRGSESTTSLAQASKQWVLPARAKPGRKPIQKGDEDEGETKRKAQNRASQRAFRERKQAHLSEMEAKIEAYERGAVQQTVDIQRVAQRVQTENDALKAEAQQLRVRNAELEKQLEAMKVQLQYLNAGLARAQTITQSSSTLQTAGSSSEFGCKPPAHEIIHRVAEAAACIPVDRHISKSDNKRKRTSRSSDEGDLPLVSPVASVPLSAHAKPRSTTERSGADADTSPPGTSKPVTDSTAEFAEILHDDDCGFCADNTPCPCRDAVQPVSPAPVVQKAQSSTQTEVKKKLWYTVPEPIAPAKEAASTSRSSSDEDEAVCTGDPSMCNACQRDPKLAEFCGAIASSLVDEGSLTSSAPLVPMQGIVGLALPISPSSLYTSSRTLRSDSLSGSRPRLLSSSSVPGGLHGTTSLSPPLPYGSSVTLPRLSVALLSPSSGGQARNNFALQLPPLPLSRRQGSSGAGENQRRLWRVDPSSAKSPPVGDSNSISAAPTPVHPLQSSNAIARSSFQQSSSRASLLPSSSISNSRPSSGSAPASSVSHAWAQIRAHPRFPAYTGGLDLLADVVARRSGTPIRADTPADTGRAPSTSDSDKRNADPDGEAGSSTNLGCSTNTPHESSKASGESRSHTEMRAPKRRRIFVSEQGVRDALALLDGIETPNVELDQPCPCPWLKDGEDGKEARRSRSGPMPFDGPSRS